MCGAIYTFLENYIFPDQKPFIITLIISCSMITALMGSMIAGLICLKIGRRKTMMIFDVVGAIGVILTLVADIGCMFAGRLLIGLMVGVSSIAAPMYISETVPAPYRSHFANVPGVFSATGFLFAALGAQLMPAELAPGQTDNTWRIMISFSIFLPVIRTFNFLVFFKDETPYFYVHNKKYKKAAKEMKKISSGNVAERMTQMLNEKNYMHKKGHFPLSAIVSKRFRLAVLVCTVLLCLQHFCGNSIILVFIGRVYKFGWVGSRRRVGSILGISTALVNLLASMITVYTTSRFGRRKLIIFGTFGCAAILLVYGILAASIADDSLIAKTFLVFRPIFSNLSLGSILNMTVAETLPDFGFSMASLINWTLAFLTLQFFPDAAEDLGYGWTFIMYGLLTAAGGVLLIFTLVDSKGKSKDEVLKLYSGIEEPAKKDEKAIEDSHKEALAQVYSLEQEMRQKARQHATGSVDQEGKALKHKEDDLHDHETKPIETTPSDVLIHVTAK